MNQWLQTLQDFLDHAVDQNINALASIRKGLLSLLGGILTNLCAHYISIVCMLLFRRSLEQRRLVL